VDVVPADRKVPLRRQLRFPSLFPAAG
jgi:hypothetical protein